jgi:hypothetical protein
MAYLQVPNARLQSIVHRVDAVLVDKVHQALVGLPWRTEHALYTRLPQHPHRLLELLVGGIQGTRELLEFAAGLVVGALHAAAEHA